MAMCPSRTSSFFVCPLSGLSWPSVHPSHPTSQPLLSVFRAHKFVRPPSPPSWALSCPSSSSYLYMFDPPTLIPSISFQLHVVVFLSRDTPPNLTQSPLFSLFAHGTCSNPTPSPLPLSCHAHDDAGTTWLLGFLNFLASSSRLSLSLFRLSKSTFTHAPPPTLLSFSTLVRARDETICIVSCTCSP